MRAHCSAFSLLPLKLSLTRLLVKRLLAHPASRNNLPARSATRAQLVARTERNRPNAPRWPVLTCTLPLVTDCKRARASLLYCARLPQTTSPVTRRLLFRDVAQQVYPTTKVRFILPKCPLECRYTDAPAARTSCHASLLARNAARQMQDHAYGNDPPIPKSSLILTKSGLYVACSACVLQVPTTAQVGEIVDMYVDAMDPTIRHYKITWPTWKREDGSNTTWMSERDCMDQFAPILNAWKRKYANGKAKLPAPANSTSLFHLDVEETVYRIRHPPHQRLLPPSHSAPASVTRRDDDSDLDIVGSAARPSKIVARKVRLLHTSCDA